MEELPRLRVLIAEDHELVRAGFRALLGADAAFEVVGEASTGPEALELAERLEPDVALLDIRMPGMNGLAVTRKLQEARPRVRVLIVSAFDDADYVNEALRAGAAGYLLKTATPSELTRAIQSAAAGAVVLDAGISQRLAGRLSSGPAPHTELTPREAEVLALVARGLANKQIASRLHLGLRTVEGHVTQILAKLGAGSRTEAAVWATTHGVVDREE
ncbi:MAG: response regulator [Acidimicrobiales bacterium]